MKERIIPVQDGRIINYSIALSNALKLGQDIKKHIQEGEGMVYRTIRREDNSSGSIHLEIGDDLLRIAQGAAYGAYNELACHREIDKESGKARRVIDPDGKQVADCIIERLAK